MESEERIGPSVLADRLAHLEKRGIIAKKPDETDKRKFIYSLTEKGQDVIPILFEIALWGTKHSPHPVAPDAWYRASQHDKEKLLALYREAVASGSSFMNGPNSVVKRLEL